MLLCGCFEIVLLAITTYPTASVYSFQACRLPTRMLVDSQFCNKLNAAIVASFNLEGSVRSRGENGPGARVVSATS
jgi:hypothetical protein